MSMLTPELLRDLVAEARLAPSVHNIQPTRWRGLPDGRLALVDDRSVRAPAADPSGHDVRVSHGAEHSQIHRKTRPRCGSLPPCATMRS